MLALPLRLPTAPYGGHMGHFLLSILALMGSTPLGNIEYGFPLRGTELEVPRAGQAPFSLRLLSSALLVSQAKSIGTLRDATPHAPTAIRRLHAYALSVVAVVAQLPLSSSAALATTPSFSTRLASFSASLSLRPPSSEWQTFCIYPGVFNTTLQFT